MSYLDKILENLESTIEIEEKADSERQRRWACAQMGKSRKKFKGKPSLSKKEAEKMCTDPLKKEVDEYLDSLLLEARVKDVKAKYPILTASGWIEWGRQALTDSISAKAVSKYLMWFAYSIDFQFDIEKSPDRDNVEPEDLKDNTDILQIAEVMIDLLAKFERNKGRIEEKDIYKYNPNQLQKAVEALAPSRSEKDAQEQEEAIEGSEIVYEDNGIFAVRPYDENASCFYGKNTRWCISATESYNHFLDYTKEGNAFVMVRFNNLPENNQYRRIAIVFDDLGAYRTAFDAPDDEIDLEMVGDAIHANITAPLKVPPHTETGWEVIADQPEALELWTRNGGMEKGDPDEIKMKAETTLKQLLRACTENVMDNPPSDSAEELIEDKVDELLKEYQDDPTEKYVYVHAEVLEGGRVYFSSGFDIPVSSEILEKVEDEDDLVQKVILAFDEQSNVYVDRIDFDNWSGEGQMRIELRVSDLEPTPSGLESIIRDAVDINKRYEGLKRIVNAVLKQEGLMDKTAFDNIAFSDDYLEQLNNFEVLDNRSYTANQSIIFRSVRFGLEDFRVDAKMLNDLNFSRNSVTQALFNQSLNDRVMDRLNSFNKKIIDALKKQLPLPGIPQQEIPDLTLPEMMQVAFANNPSGAKSIQLLLSITPDVNQENIDSIFGIIKFIDENFEDITQIVDTTVKVFIKQGMQALQQQVQASEPADSPEVDTSDDVFEQVNDYFKQILKTDLEKRIEKTTIKEWLDPESPAPWDNDYKDVQK